MAEYKQVCIISTKINQSDLVKKTIESPGYRVSSIKNAENLYSTIAKIGNGLILFDLESSPVDISTFFTRMKKDKLLDNFSVIILTEKNNIEEIVTALTLGASDYIDKPVNEIILSLKIENHFKQRESCHKFSILNQQISGEKEAIQKERDILAKYFSQDLIDALTSGAISTKIGGGIKTATILFCDIRNSTTIAEHLDPASFMSLVNNLFADLTDIIYGEGGSVNKFVGDGILATFGCPKEIEDSALHCARVALKIRKYLDNFNQFRPEYIEEPIQMGMGISHGQVFAGNVGSVYQIQYTVLGDPVNLASRLESLTKNAGIDILIDGNTRDILGSNAKVKQARVSHVRGKLDKVRVFYLESLLSLK